MQEHIVALKTTFLILFLFNINFAQGIDEINDGKKIEKNIIANYCLDSTAKELLVYEQIIPLNIDIETKRYDSDYSMSANLEAPIKFSSKFLGLGAACMGYIPSKKTSYKCIVRNEKYEIYDTFDILSLDYSFMETTVNQLSVLFDKTFPVKWQWGIKIDSQSLNLSGSYNIYISGICTEEQLKKIEENKEEKENIQ